MKTFLFSLILSFLGVAPFAQASNVQIYKCNQISQQNLNGNAINTAFGGQITLSRDDNPPAVESSTPVIIADIQLVDKNGALIRLMPYNSFAGSIEARPTSDKCFNVDKLVETNQSLTIDSECLNETNEGRDWYRSRKSLRLNKQTNYIQYTETLRTCDNDFFGKCSFGSFVPQVSVEMICQPTLPL